MTFRLHVKGGSERLQIMFLSCELREPVKGALPDRRALPRLSSSAPFTGLPALPGIRPFDLGPGGNRCGRNGQQEGT
jgi:hypothetical protein